MAKIDDFIDKLSKDDVEIEKKAKAVREHYRYFNEGMTLEAWMWESIRRNPDYIALYNEIRNDFMTVDILQDDEDLEGIHDNILDSPIGLKLKRLLNEFGIQVSLIKPKPHDADNFMNIDKYDFLIEIPNPTKGYDQFCRKTPEIEGGKSVRCLTLTVDNKNSFIVDGRYLNTSSFLGEECRKVMMEDLPPVDPSDTIYVGISMSAKKSDILQDIGTLITPMLKTTKKRARDDKWNYYFIAYDLFIEGYKYSNISKIMSKAYENEVPEEIQDEEALKKDNILKKKAKALMRLFDEKNIENYHKNALQLINGGYKDHLFLKK